MKKEVGSFIELEFQKGKEYYNGKDNVARLNSGRTGIFHAIRLYGCKKVYLPIYQCETVRTFLERKGISIQYYKMDSEFKPLLDTVEDDACVVIVNYFGIMSQGRMQQLAERFQKVIIDNSQAFFAGRIDGVYQVYSPRKFVGVPDGGYVIGDGAERYVNDYAQGFSSDTSLFLLQRIEYGCEGKTYENRSTNEERIDTEDIMQMSKLTHTILDSYDYETVKKKRRDNFEMASKLFDDVNLLNVHQYYDESCIPMVYPLVIEDDMLLNRLLEAKHFQGRWWNYILKETKEEDFEHWLSKYMIPITIDQRYGVEDLEYIRGLL